MRQDVETSGHPIGKRATWCLRADPWPVLFLAIVLMFGYFWVFRTPTVAMVALNYYFDFCLGLFLFGLLAGARGIQVLVRNSYEARLGVQSTAHRSRRWFWPWLLLIAGLTTIVIRWEFPMHVAFLLSQSALDRVADEAIANPANAHRLSGRWAGMYRINGVEVIGQTVVLYLGEDRGNSGFARVPGATSDLIVNMPWNEDSPHYHRDFPEYTGHNDPAGTRVKGDWFVMYSMYWRVKVGWS